MKDQIIIIHPGEMLREEFLLPNNISPEELARGIKCPLQVVENIISEKQDIDKDIATRLALYFDMSTEFWLGIQHKYEQASVKKLRSDLKKKIIPFYQESFKS